ncbi:hypothetical protein RFI_07056 [Reticulomyxa filosa]|uniref:Prolyl 4-hydroxylase alpha subunit domain-containing protein n=1 Tax=Reticulomyxa filosa TaxID=46433 RepID=X6NVZ9_RETFI|nr:hypothetical protein RFI_07056 [Reticulomyxa filosa]|eukprot:ETO30063.1 hypothetical protein RFI_07056 [Reticulomyxa filosa]
MHVINLCIYVTNVCYILRFLPLLLVRPATASELNAEEQIGPKIQTPLPCEQVRVTDDGQIRAELLVPFLHYMEYSKEYEWTGFLRSDSQIWDYDIPPTPNAYIELMEPKVINTSYSKQMVSIIFQYPAKKIYKEKGKKMMFHELSCRLVNKKSLNLLSSKEKFNPKVYFYTINEKNDNNKLEDEITVRLTELLQQHKQVQERLKHENDVLQKSYLKTSNEYEKYIKKKELYTEQDWIDRFVNNKYDTNNDNNGLLSLVDTIDKNGLYKFKQQLFTNEFLDILSQELDNAYQIRSNHILTLKRPNSMNNDGFVLKQLGLGNAIFYFFEHFLQHINDDTDHSIVYFDGIRDVSDPAAVNVSLSNGETIFHLGQWWHGANSITFGERINMILWFRSSHCRTSITSYMLDQCPSLVPDHNTKTQDKEDL